MASTNTPEPVEVAVADPRGPLVKYRVVQDALVFRTGKRDEDVLIFKNGDVLELFSETFQTKGLLEKRALATLDDAPERVRVSARQVAFALGGVTDHAMESLPEQPQVPLMVDGPVAFPADL